MSKYDNTYLRTMSWEDLECEPETDMVDVLLDHMHACEGVKLSQRSIAKYSRLFFKHYKPEQLSTFLQIVGRSSNVFDCINVNDPDFIIKFKYEVMMHGDSSMKAVVNGIMHGYDNQVVRHIVMFSWAYLSIRKADVRVLADFFSGINNLSDKQLQECTNMFVKEDWTTEKMIEYMTGDLTLEALYYKKTGNYGLYLKSRIQQSLRKTYDDFDPRKLPTISSKYKPDRRLFRV